VTGNTASDTPAPRTLCAPLFVTLKRNATPEVFLYTQVAIRKCGWWLSRR